MALVRFEPLRELTALQNEMGRWMSVLSGSPTTGGNGHSSTWLPAVDVWETGGEVVLSFDLPGIPEDKIAVELDDNVLTVSGERERTQEHSSERFYRFERRYGTFSRSVTLPAGVTDKDISANYKDGVLEVRIPKPEEQKPKRIQVGTQGAIEGKSTRK